MRKIILLVLVSVTMVFATESPRTQREKIEIVIVQAPSKEPRNPYQDEYERMLYPTVRISSPSGTGSGVVISVERGAYSVEGITILTAAHVVENETTVNIELYNSTVITATVVITDTDKDLALIRVIRSIRDIRVIYSARLAPRNYTPYIFTPVYSVGCSLGLAPRPSQGIISAINTDSWEVTSPILPGNSGGPVFDEHIYQVIGITVWVKTCQGQFVTTMAGIVPIQEIHTFLESYKRLQ